MEQTIEIQKRARPAVLVFVSILFVAIGAIGIWILVSLVFPRLEGFWDLKISAIAAIATASIVGIVFVFQQTSRTKPGLIIDDRGLTDNSNILSVGFIPWSDISTVQEDANLFKQKLILIVVKNPATYINKTPKMRESRQIQYKQFGTPIVISADNLEYDSEQLMAMLRSRVWK